MGEFNKKTIENLQKNGKDITLCHFNYINPLPKNTQTILNNYKKIVVCELNSGQFVNHLRINFPTTIFHQYNKTQGLPFTTNELEIHFKFYILKGKKYGNHFIHLFLIFIGDWIHRLKKC